MGVRKEKSGRVIKSFEAWIQLESIYGLDTLNTVNFIELFSFEYMSLFLS